MESMIETLREKGYSVDEMKSYRIYDANDDYVALIDIDGDLARIVTNRPSAWMKVNQMESVLHTYADLREFCDKHLDAYRIECYGIRFDIIEKETTWRIFCLGDLVMFDGDEDWKTRKAFFEEWEKKLHE